MSYAVAVSAPCTPRVPPRPRRKRKIVALATLGLAGLVAGLLSGCAGASNSATSTGTPPGRSYAALAGNWKFTTGSASGVTSLAGSLAVNGDTVSGMLHLLQTTCHGNAASFPVTGSVDAENRVSLHALASASGITLAISGALADDRQSLLTPVVTVTDESCATVGSSRRLLTAHEAIPAGPPSAQQFQPLTGNYSGSFTDQSGAVLPVAATFSQPTQPASDGVYHLTGYATFAANSCLKAPVITDSTVSGDSLHATYTDQESGNAVEGTGTFSSDARTVAITNWVLAGCGGDTGTGLLTRQAN